MMTFSSALASTDGGYLCLSALQLYTICNTNGTTPNLYSHDVTNPLPIFAALPTL